MELLPDLKGDLFRQYLQEQGLISRLSLTVASIIVVGILVNILKQLLFKSPNEPPLIFHWLPFIGSTVTYGMDPPRFFKENRAKVPYLPT